MLECVGFNFSVECVEEIEGDCMVLFLFNDVDLLSVVILVVDESWMEVFVGFDV